MVKQPTGTVTLLFTDIEGSTRLLERLGPERYRESLELHRQLLREVFERHGGYEVDYEGDAFFVAFSAAGDAVAAAAESQQALAEAEWPEGLPVRVRMGVHTGEPLPAPPKYVGLDVHKAARIMAAGHGGQVLVSAATQELLNGAFAVVALGEHRLKDLSQPEPLYQLQIDGLQIEFPAVRTLDNRPNNLPVVATPFIGRDSDLEQVRAVLLHDQVRLLTLTGPGGIGKTRLALQVAADVLDSFSSGVFWVPLAAVRNSALVVPAIAEALALREEPGEPVMTTLTRYLASKELLLVLDNFEHVVDAAAEVSAILRATPKLCVLTTSREALLLQGEHLHDVPPLPLPAADDVASVEAADSVQLFLARARATGPEFGLTEANAVVIAEIVRRLDGVPLALELAAARVRELPPHALLRRLDSRLRILTSGSRDAEERQRTLRATIEWSYELLSLDEKKLFARLGVFVGGSRLDAAETVCDYDGTLSLLVFDGITSLLQKSLVRRRDDPDGEPRYWMLETIREYALERLASGGDEAEVRLAGAEHFADQVERAAPELVGERQALWLDLLAADHDNLRSALATFAGRGLAEQRLQLATRLWRFWWLRGLLSEGRTVLADALAVASAASPSLQIEALGAAASFAMWQGDYEAQRLLATESLNTARQFGDRRALALAVRGLALALDTCGQPEQALPLHEESLAIRREIGDPREIGVALAGLASAARARGDHDRARKLWQESLPLLEQAGDRYARAISLFGLAFAALEQRRAEDVPAYLLEALTLSEELNYLEGIAYFLLGAAAFAVATGDAENGARLLGTAQRLSEELGFTMSASERNLAADTAKGARSALHTAAADNAFADGRDLNAAEATTIACKMLAATEP